MSSSKVVHIIQSVKILASNKSIFNRFRALQSHNQAYQNLKYGIEACLLVDLMIHSSYIFCRAYRANYEDIFRHEIYIFVV